MEKATNAVIEEQKYHPYTHLVREAMLVSVLTKLHTSFIDYHWPGIEYGADIVTHARRRLTMRTYRQCADASDYVVYYLFVRYPSSFDTLVLLDTDSFSSASPFRVASWSGHTCFLARDMDGVWHAGSPANYTEEGENPLTKLASSLDLSTVLHEVTQFEGGIWPDAADTTRVLTHHNRMPFYLHDRDKSVRIFSITNRAYLEKVNGHPIDIPRKTLDK